MINCGKISLTFDIPLIDAIVASTAKDLSCDSILSDDEHYEKFCRQNRIKLLRW
jgi:predicted nucleic acid-binding protein